MSTIVDREVDRLVGRCLDGVLPERPTGLDQGRVVRVARFEGAPRRARRRRRCVPQRRLDLYVLADPRRRLMLAEHEVRGNGRPCDQAVSDQERLERSLVVERTLPAWQEPLERYTAHMRAAGARHSTIRLRLWLLHKLSRTIFDPWSATIDDLVDFIGDARWGPEARKSARSAVRGFYRWAHESGRVDVDPSIRLPSVRVPAGVPRPTPESVFTAALEVATDRERLMLMLAGYAGLRCMEVAGVRFDDIRGHELFVNGKGGRVRVVPLHPALVDELAREQAVRRGGGIGSGWRFKGDRAAAEEYVFPGQSGGPMTPWNVSTTLSRMLGPGFTGHTLRHRFASQAYAGTRDLRAVQTLLGHSKPETTARYTAVPDGALVAAVAAAGPRASIADSTPGTPPSRR